ncbi:trypsin-like peptidase domain-containing protein [Haloferula chungangensis]|uniref:Trypsin-like peptidase domain-containing protein n=1 Tax=Haloferula chungangensis TaxID=1048331 RepID=A0ABW2L7Y0_9BACT
MTEGIRRLLTLVTVFLVMFLAVFFIRNGPEGFRRWFTDNDERQTYRPEQFTLSDEAALEVEDVELLTRLNNEYARLTDAVVPSVVSIDTRGIQARRRIDNYGRQLYRTVPTQGQGSGVIVSREGHVVTNYHVVKDQQEIEITLYDGRVISAAMIGEDPILDIAVLKIEDEGPFQPLKFGDSDEVRRGQITFAFGNPFGLGETVTQGIISAVERSLSDTQRDLIQTDAAINPGNSGGPLVNLQGEIIGINSSIYRPDERVNSGFQGVGFSIPSNDVKQALLAILDRGRPIHGFLGVQMYPSPLAKAAVGYQGPGALVGAVLAESPAELAGIQANDVIVRFNGKPIEDRADLFTLVQRSRVGQEVPVEIWRAGENQSLKVKIAEREFVARPGSGALTTEQEKVLGAVGVAVRDLSQEEVMAGYQGVVVTEISPGGLAAGVLLVGDLIELVNQSNFRDSSDFYRNLANSVATQATSLQLIRKGQRGRLTLPPLPQQPKEDKIPENMAEPDPEAGPER